MDDIAAGPVDSKSKHILSFLLPFLRLHCSQPSYKPFILAVSGIQGCGKTTLVTQLGTALHSLGYHSISISVDDFYHTASILEQLAKTKFNGNDKLLQQRGPPGTHDLALADAVFDGLSRINDKQGNAMMLPTYDKGAKGGKGDRRPDELWAEVNGPLDVIVLEGWCIGFRPLPKDRIEEIVRQAEKKYGMQAGEMSSVYDLKKGSRAEGRELSGAEVLLEHRLEHLLDMNQCLDEYCQGFMNPQSFDAMIHLDAEDLKFVYGWRLQQEHRLWESGGQGMSDEEVERFGKSPEIVSDRGLT
ncbi:MAG: hypothetical protein Q9167_004142 [Letrouitia subvulpina]